MDYGDKHERGAADAPFAQTPSLSTFLGHLPSDLVPLVWASAYTGQTERTLARMAQNGSFPKVYDFGPNGYRVSSEAFRIWVATRAVSKANPRLSEAQTGRHRRAR